MGIINTMERGYTIGEGTQREERRNSREEENHQWQTGNNRKDKRRGQDVHPHGASIT